jgi:hypothetical protein
MVVIMFTELHVPYLLLQRSVYKIRTLLGGIRTDLFYGGGGSQKSRKIANVLCTRFLIIFVKSINNVNF